MRAPARDPSPAVPPVWRVRLAAAGMVLAVLAAYANSFRGVFVFDDLPAIRDNPSLHDWRTAFSPPAATTVTGRPLVNASLALSRALSGDAPWGYHLVNVAIHAAAALVLFGLIRRTLQRPALARRFGKDTTLVAAVAALLWALHPLVTHGVTYLVQRAEALTAWCALATLYAWIRGAAAEDAMADTAGGPGRAHTSRGWFAAAVLTCGAGMASKEIMVAVPLLVLLFDRTFLAGSFGVAWRRRRGWYVALGATWLLLAALVLGAGGNRNASIGFGIGVSAWTHALTQFPALTRYLHLTLWPQPLVFEYEPEWVRSLVSILPEIALVLALAAATAIGVVRRSAVGVIGTMCFAVLAPTSLLPAPREFIVEYRAYLPLAALTALAVPAAYVVLGRRTLLAAGITAALALGLLTHMRNEAYRSELALWSDTVAKRPANATARSNLGNALVRAGRVDEAVAQCAEAVRLEPDNPLVQYNLGSALDAAGRTSDAIAHYAEAVRLNPRYADAHNNYAVALIRAGRQPEALPELETTVALRPSDATARYNLATLLSELGRPDAALAQFAAAVRLRPNFPEALVRWGTTLALAGRIPEALDRYDAALRVDPNNVAARNKQGLVLLMVGRVPEAVQTLQEAVRLDPANAEARSSLALAQRRLAAPAR